MAETLVEKAIRESEQACQAAIAGTPKPYRGFITLIQQSKKVGGGRQSPIYASIRLPYMGVDGRVKMAMDEHRAAGARLTFDTTYETIGDRLLCRALVNSSLLGTAVGYAEVNVGGNGVDASNPFSNGQTSAIGRALGFLGYGLFGNGIASAEEVMKAIEEQTEVTQTAETTPIARFGDSPPQGPVGDPNNPAHQPATQKQLGMLYALLKDNGVKEGDKRSLISFYYGDNLSKSACSALIDYMKTNSDLEHELKKAYVKYLVKNNGLDRVEVAAQMDKTYGHHDPSRLSKQEFGTFIDTLIPVPAVEPDDIYMPGEQVAETSKDEPSVKEWVDFIKDKCTECKLTASQFERWAIGSFSNGSVKNVTELPRETFNSISAMDIETISAEVKAFHGETSQQEALIV